MSDERQIKEYVRKRYGARARTTASLTVLTTADAACCAADDAALGAFPELYRQAELEGLPTAAVAASAGCGNPTALAGLQPGERVLDLGSGGGIDCFLAARQVGPEGHVTGLDMTPDMLALARKNATKMGIENVKFVHGELENMPLPDASVDVVISNCVVCLSPDKDAVFLEAFRVLAPGGRMHISDMMALGPVPQEVRDDPEKWAACIAGADQRDEYAGRLAAAGFHAIEMKQEGAGRPMGEGTTEVASVKVVAFKPA